MRKTWIQFRTHDSNEYVSVYRIIAAKQKVYTGRILFTTEHFDPCFNAFDRPDAQMLERIMSEFKTWRRLVALGLAFSNEYVSEDCPSW